MPQGRRELGLVKHPFYGEGEDSTQKGLIYLPFLRHREVECPGGKRKSTGERKSVQNAKEHTFWEVSVYLP